MAPGDVKLSVKNKEDFDVVRAGFLFPAKAGNGGDSRLSKLPLRATRLRRLPLAATLRLLHGSGRADRPGEARGLCR